MASAICRATSFSIASGTCNYRARGSAPSFSRAFLSAPSELATLSSPVRREGRILAMRILVLGGTRFLGKCVVEGALRRG